MLCWLFGHHYRWYWRDKDRGGGNEYAFPFRVVVFCERCGKGRG